MTTNLYIGLQHYNKKSHVTFHFHIFSFNVPNRPTFHSSVMWKHIRHIRYISQNFSYTKHITSSEARTAVASYYLWRVPQAVNADAMCLIYLLLCFPRRHGTRLSCCENWVCRLGYWLKITSGRRRIMQIRACVRFEFCIQILHTEICTSCRLYGP